MAQLTFASAVRDGLAEEMRRDPTVWVLGEDITTAAGNTSAEQYVGLVEEFGSKRVVNTPISESTIMAAAVGAAVNGTRPVADLRLADFGLCAIDELVNQAAKIRYMFGGQARVPLVVRQAIGTPRGYAAQHSLSNEAWFVHVPGLVVVTPATPADGKALLKAAIRCPDPVVFLEHKELWGSKGEVSGGDDVVAELGKANVLRGGKDLTIVAWSKMSRMALAAAEKLSSDGIDAEVIDLRTLWPWDKEAVLASVRKTRRLLIPQESVQVAGFCNEVMATVVEECTDVPTQVRRLGAPRIHVPYAENLEQQYRVTEAHVYAVAREMCSGVLAKGRQKVGAFG